MAKSGNEGFLMHSRMVRLRTKSYWKHNGDSWCLFHLRDGTGILQEGLDRQRMNEGEVAVLSSGIKVTFQAGAPRAIGAHTLNFNPGKLSGTHSLGARLLLCQAAKRSKMAMLVPRQSSLAAQMEVIAHFQDSMDVRNSHDTIEMIPLIDPLIREFKEVLKSIQNGADIAHERVISVLDKISEPEVYELSVDDLAQRCGCSRRHLSRLVKDHCGCSLNSLRIQMRLDHAASRLHDPSTKIIDIAMDCGFGHLGSFSARFRERFGTTPGEWRRQSLNGSHNSSHLARMKVGADGESGRTRPHHAQ